LKDEKIIAAEQSAADKQKTVRNFVIRLGSRSWSLHSAVRFFKLTGGARTAGLLNHRTSLRGTIEPVILAMRHHFRESELRICLGDFPDIEVACDEADLNAMGLMLIDQASNNAKSRVIISWERDSSWVLIYFDDDGSAAASGKRLHGRGNDELPKEGSEREGDQPTMLAVQALAAKFQGWVSVSKSPLGGLRTELALKQCVQR
jgi:hypothetical protein